MLADKIKEHIKPCFLGTAFAFAFWNGVPEILSAINAPQNPQALSDRLVERNILYNHRELRPVKEALTKLTNDYLHDMGAVECQYLPPKCFVKSDKIIATAVFLDLLAKLDPEPNQRKVTELYSKLVP